MDRIPPLAASDIERLLRDWRALNAELPGLPVEGVHLLLREAVSRKCRWQVVHRIYSRFNRLRMLYEIKTLKAGQLHLRITGCP